MTGETGWIYTLHLHKPLGSSGRNSAQHYTGWAADLPARLAAHRNGTGAAMMAYCAAAGIGWHVGGLTRGTRTDERRMKQHGAARRCWTCQAAEREQYALAAELPQSIPLDDLTEYEYEINLPDRWTPPPPADKLDISN